jgi:hypothetical protein
VTELLAPYATRLSAAGDDRIVAFAPKTISRRAVSRGDSALGDLVTDALREATSADVAIMNSTGIRADVVAGAVSAGDVTRVLPFSDAVSVVTFTASDLATALRGPARDACAGSAPTPFEVAGIRVTVNCSPLSVVLDGLPGLPQGTDSFRVAAPSFLTDGKYLAPASPNQLESSNESVRDAVVRALERRASCADAGAAGLEVPCLVATADGRVRLR